MSVSLQNRFREMTQAQFLDSGLTNENSLVKAMLDRPDTLTPVVTHMLGQYSKKFPLTFLSEGQPNGTSPMGKGNAKAMNNVQFEWPFINHHRRSDDVISSTYVSTDRPGLGFTPFYVTMKTQYNKVQHTVESSSGTRARILSKPVPEGPYWKYALQLLGTDPNAYCPLADLQAGARWTMVGGANVAQSLSMGNESNSLAPGWMRNQLGTIRKSYTIGGNISSKKMTIQFNIGGKMTNLWIDWDHFVKMIEFYEHLEENLWYSEYNRTPEGIIYQKDPDTGLPIHYSAGLLQQIPNRNTYSTLTANKIKNGVRDVMFGATDTDKMDIVLYTGTGGFEEFDNAMKAETRNLGFNIVQDNRFVRGAGGNLIFGGYFKQYEHIDGHVITVKHLPLLDKGGRALAGPKHARSGLPITSYDMYFIDQSTYDGEPNVTMQYEEGRMMKTGVVAGMATMPAHFGGNSNSLAQISTEQDVASIHFLTTKAITMRRNTHSLMLTCDQTNG